MLKATMATLKQDHLDAPLRQPLADFLAHALASGREVVSTQEIYWRLRLPEKQQLFEKYAIARVLKSFGWVKVRYGNDARGQRIYGWRWREWNVTQVKIDLRS